MPRKKEIKDVCPYCGCDKFVVGFQGGYATVNPNKFSLKSEKLYHVICTECGIVVRSFVSNPKKLIVEKEK